MASTSVVKDDLIPYSAGVVVLTPLDENWKPDYTRAVATPHNFLQSTQTSSTRNSETLPNGNGQDQDYPIDETFNFTVVSNVYSPTFHNAAAGRIESLPKTVLTWDEFTHNLPQTVEAGGVLEIAFGKGKDCETLPGADEYGNYNFIIQDSYGNELVRREQPVFGAYVYDKDTHALQFSEEYKGAAIRVLYQIERTDALVYVSNPILKQPRYQIETFGISMSASSDAKYQVYQKILRATLAGDLSEPPTQKSKSAAITYNFKSTPVPEGVSAYTKVTTPLTSGTSAGDNIVNGGDDDFSSATKPGIGDDIDQGEV